MISQVVPIVIDRPRADRAAAGQAHLAGEAPARRWLVTDFPGRLRPIDRFEFK